MVSYLSMHGSMPGNQENHVSPPQPFHFHAPPHPAYVEENAGKRTEKSEAKGKHRMISFMLWGTHMN